jgi:alkylhydroperoxidase/carboxymuconolactone decarboxylase family protein YurZ
MTSTVPGHYQRFTENHPRIADAYKALGDACHTAGPLDTKTRALIKLGIAIGHRHQGAVHSHARKALDAGATAEEIRHVVLLATTTIGFPGMMAGLSWVEDVLGKA